MRTLYNNVLLVAFPVTFLTMMSISIIGFPAQAQTPAFDKSNFHDPLKIDNKFFFFKPGAIMIYNGTDEEGKPLRDVITH
jgi:hypothetical protein